MPKQHRREFMKHATAAVAFACLSSAKSDAVDTSDGNDWAFAPATDALDAIREKRVSSIELITETFARIQAYNPKINAFVTLLEEQAMERAREADAVLAKGDSWGPLHGLPILVKDSYQTAGVKTTCGSELLATFVPLKNAVAVERLLEAGAIMVGKTNLPEFAGDMQTFNKLAGTTNNPWNLERTPGGSTGGGAAALAAGIGFLEIGSDIGGSIRTPAHFCGIYGLKPSLNVVPLDGHIPPPPGQVDAFVELPVSGPLAQSAKDLQLELEIIGGPTKLEAKAYSWRLPAPRHKRLRDYRIGFVLDDPFCPVTPDVRTVLENAIVSLRSAGATLIEGWPTGVTPDKSYEVYMKLLAATFSVAQTKDELDHLASLPKDHLAFEDGKLWEEGSTFSHVDWLKVAPERIRQRQRWQSYFKDVDAFLMPTAFTTAIAHDHSMPQLDREIDTSQGARAYTDLLAWIHFATLTGNPAVVAPVGLAADGLPVGIQIIGPYLEDATPIHLAELMETLTGGFQAPEGFK